MSANAAALTRWFTAANDALDSGAPLTVEHLKALAAMPDHPTPDKSARRTWWLEEYERVTQQKMRDRFPDAPHEIAAWRDRQAMYDDRLEGLASDHADALNAAAVRPKKPRTPKPKRLTAAQLSLQAAMQHLPDTDHAA